MKDKIHILTRQEVIENVSHNWDWQYSGYPSDSDKAEIGRKLKSMRDREKIDELIGNNSWTKLECTACEVDVEVVAMLPATQEYGPEPYCLGCLKQAVSLLEEKGE